MYTASVEPADIFERCAERGLPVFVEKPMATILDQASRTIDGRSSPRNDADGQLAHGLESLPVPSLPSQPLRMVTAQRSSIGNTEIVLPIEDHLFRR